MTGETTLKEVIARLGRAIEGLESAVAARLEHERDYSEAEAEVQRMNADRSRRAEDSTDPRRAPSAPGTPTRKCRAGW